MAKRDIDLVRRIALAVRDAEPGVALGEEDFADLVADDTAWNRFREKILKPAAGYTFQSILDVGSAMATAAIMKAAGL